MTGKTLYSGRRYKTIASNGLVLVAEFNRLLKQGRATKQVTYDQCSGIFKKNAFDTAFGNFAADALVEFLKQNDIDIVEKIEQEPQNTLSEKAEGESIKQAEKPGSRWYADPAFYEQIADYITVPVPELRGLLERENPRTSADCCKLLERHSGGDPEDFVMVRDIVLAQFDKNMPAENMYPLDKASASMRRRVDNPINRYQQEIKGFSLLSEKEELELAQEICIAKRRLRRQILSSELGQRTVLQLLEEVYEGARAYARTVDGRVRLEKERFFAQFSGHAETIRKMLYLNRADYETVCQGGLPQEEKIWGRIRCRQKKGYVLLEELGVHTGHLLRIFSKMKRFSVAMDHLSAEINRLKSGLVCNEVRGLQQGLVDVVMERPEDFKRRVQESEMRLKEFEAARNKLASGNLRLVVYIAKRCCCNSAVSLLDLIQEGNTGLLTAAERYDFTRGVRFVTYAAFWIRAAITRAIVNKEKIVRIPVHLVSSIQKVRRVANELVQNLGRPPEIDEIADAAGMTAEEVMRISRLSTQPGSLERYVNADEESTVGQFVENEKAEPPASRVIDDTVRERIFSVLEELAPREREIIKYRFGFYGFAYALEEIGRIFNVTRERIRQIESKALRRLQNPIRMRKLEGCIDEILPVKIQGC